uniref:Col_cuticle_N domain-containing protein n=1 Tax=Steinernema glaseri TaxID=37863 RepID=A0A1I7Y7I3_9BILA
MEKQLVLKAESLKRAAFFGVAISTVATLTAIVVIPMMYAHMQNVETTLQEEIHFCQRRTHDLWDRYAHLQKDGFQGRLKRAANHRAEGMTGHRAAARGYRTYDIYDHNGGNGGSSAGVVDNGNYGGISGGSIGVDNGGSFVEEASCCSCGIGLAGPP